MTTGNGWYRLAPGSDLEQGDLLEGVPFYVPQEHVAQPNPGQEASFHLTYYDVIVLTATCDLVEGKGKTDSVLLCPHFDLAELAKQSPKSVFAKPEFPGEIDKGRRPRYCLLAPSDISEKPMNLRIIDFARALSLPLPYVVRHATENQPRLRINSPYREYVAQAFGTCYTRVGLLRRASDY